MSEACDDKVLVGWPLNWELHLAAQLLRHRQALRHCLLEPGYFSCSIHTNDTYRVVSKEKRKLPTIWKMLHKWNDHSEAITISVNWFLFPNEE